VFSGISTIFQSTTRRFFMKVKVLKLGHSATEVEAPHGSTVEEVLNKADMPFSGYSISVNGLGAGPATAVTEKDVITLVPKVEGGAF
jgi:sulfur carrier protein ThiS